MSGAADSTAMSGMDDHQQGTAPDKGKGKAAEVDPQDVSMDEEDESSGEETGADEPGAQEMEEEEGQEEIDPSNILGTRTRRKNIDFKKAAEAAGDDLEDDEDDDEDFVEPTEETKAHPDAMEE